MSEHGSVYCHCRLRSKPLLKIKLFSFRGALKNSLGFAGLLNNDDDGQV
jgi:hypothetical protein